MALMSATGKVTLWLDRSRHVHAYTTADWKQIAKQPPIRVREGPIRYVCCGNRGQLSRHCCGQMAISICLAMIPIHSRSVWILNLSPFFNLKSSLYLHINSFLKVKSRNLFFVPRDWHKFGKQRAVVTKSNKLSLYVFLILDHKILQSWDFCQK